MIAVSAITLIFILLLGQSGWAEQFLLNGRVVDASGNPVEDAEVFAYDSATTRRPADFISARTGKDGTFSLSLPRGKYWTVARVRKGEKYGPLLPGDRHSGEPAEVEPGSGPELKKDFVVADIREVAQNRQKTREDYFRLSGRIVDRSGKAVKNAYVCVSGEDDIPAFISRWTDESGEYSLYLPPGKHSVRAAAQFPPEPKQPGARELLIEVKQKQTTADIEFVTQADAERIDSDHADLHDE